MSSSGRPIKNTGREYFKVYRHEHIKPEIHAEFNT
jgi:hypothetical protein